MQGDDIQKFRAYVQQAYDQNLTVELMQVLALWVIAEQLYELRALISISLERKK